MQINEIQSGAHNINVKPDPAVLSAEQAANENASAVMQKANKAQQPSAVDSVVLNNKPAPATALKQNTSKENINQKKAPAATSHVIEEYNAKGELRIKFVDNKNNIIYQIPSEMVSKMQDLMLKSDVPTDAKA